MFETIVTAWERTMAVTQKVLDRLWGTQTAQEASIQKRAEKAEAEYRAAAQRLREVDPDDKHGKIDALRALNAWRSELNRLRDEAAAKRN